MQSVGCDLLPKALHDVPENGQTIIATILLEEDGNVDVALGTRATGGVRTEQDHGRKSACSRGAAAERVDQLHRVNAGHR